MTTIAPRILTLEHIDTVLRRLPAWRGPSRVRVLKACAHRIKVLRMARHITNVQASDYRAKVLPKLREAERRLKETERKQAEALAEKETAALRVGQYMFDWLQAARVGELRAIGARLPRV